MVHGTLDDLVPVSQGRDFANALLDLGTDASLLELPHDDHGLASVYGDSPDAVTPVGQEIVDFFVRTLGPVALQ
jgi:dipeptidyl aminopeptidase/acylaminoacyl peptidase